MALQRLTKLTESWWSGAESHMAGSPRTLRKQRLPRTRRELPGDPVSRGVGAIARQFAVPTADFAGPNTGGPRLASDSAEALILSGRSPKTGGSASKLARNGTPLAKCCAKMQAVHR